MLTRTLNGTTYDTARSSLVARECSTPEPDVTESTSLLRTEEGEFFLYEEKCETDHRDWRVDQDRGWQGHVTCEIKPLTNKEADAWVMKRKTSYVGGGRYNHRLWFADGFIPNAIEPGSRPAWAL